MEFLMDALVGRQQKKLQYPAVLRADLCTSSPDILSLVHAIYRLEVIGADRLPSLGLRSSRRIMTQCLTGSSSGQPSRGNCVFSRRQSSGDPDARLDARRT